MTTDDPSGSGSASDAAEAPLLGDLVELARRPFTVDGVATMFALAVPYGLTVVPIRILSFVLGLVYLGCLAGYYFQTVDHVGRGSAGLPFSVNATTPGEIAATFGRGLACLGVAVGPAMLWSMLVPRSYGISFVLLLLGAALAPAAIVAASVAESALAALWPFNWARIISGAPAAYGKLAALFVVSCVVWTIGAFGVAGTVGLIPLVGPFLFGVANAAFALVQAVLVGGFLRRHAELGSC